MNRDSALILADMLRSDTVGRRGPLHLRAEVEGDRFVFLGGFKGSHSVELSVSTEERVIAHWEGYCEANGVALRAKPGDRVLFASGSSPSGYRTGIVTSVGRLRAQVAYSFKHGGKASKAVRLVNLAMEKMHVFVGTKGAEMNR